MWNSESTWNYLIERAFEIGDLSYSGGLYELLKIQLEINEKNLLLP